jgi:hypothetical protein
VVKVNRLFEISELVNDNANMLDIVKFEIQKEFFTNSKLETLIDRSIKNVKYVIENLNTISEELLKIKKGLKNV